MGRGRQKAKHTKIARDLKYFSPVTDYDALSRELASHEHDHDADVDGDATAAVSADVTGKGDIDLEKWPEYASDSYSATDSDDEDR